MEYEMHQLLIKRLEENLSERIIALGHKEGGPTVEDYYNLNALIEWYDYFAKHHMPTVDEMKTLLCFSEPLVVAQECWRHNTHQNSFPICEIVREIDAFTQFERVGQLPEITLLEKQERMLQSLKIALDENHTEYTNKLLGMTKQELISKSKEIACVEEAYATVRHGFSFRPSEVENLLRLGNPLLYIADNWDFPTFDDTASYDMVHDILLDLNRPDHLERMVNRFSATPPAEQKKASVREQLRDTAREASQRPPPEGRPKGGGAR